MGGFNARAGNTPVSSNVGRFGETTQNINGTQFVDFSAYNKF
jgi:hypothetical protein